MDMTGTGGVAVSGGTTGAGPGGDGGGGTSPTPVSAGGAPVPAGRGRAAGAGKAPAARGLSRDPVPASASPQSADPGAADPASLLAEEPAPFIEEDGGAGFRIKLGSKEYATLEEAEADYAALQKRLSGADKTTAAYRERAQQAVEAAIAWEKLARNAGLISEDGSLVVKSPEQVRAEMAARAAAGEPEGEDGAEAAFKMPRFFEVGDDPRATDMFFAQMEQVAADKGLRFAMALMADHIDTTLSKYHERAEAHYQKLLERGLAPIMPFHQSLAATRATGEFLTHMKGVIGQNGQPLYPELGDAEVAPVFVPRLVQALDEGGEYAHSPAGFRRIVNALRYEMAQEAEAAQAAAPPEPEPGVEDEQVSMDQPAITAAPAAPRVAGRPAQAARRQPVLVMDGAPSGVPRPRGNGRGSAGDGLTRKSQGDMGGMRFW